MNYTLIDISKSFSEELEGIPGLEKLDDGYYREDNFLVAEAAINFAYRSGLVSGKLLGLGLEKHMREIVGGMNKTNGGVLLGLTECSSIEENQRTNRVDSVALQQFALDYIDRWVMYNTLFKGKK